MRIVSGGQMGVDRAALDFAIAAGVPYGGWCPQGGWAEDFVDPPGLLAAYPLLRETPSHDPDQRTAWNVRDSDATLILVRDHQNVRSAGTELTERHAIQIKRPHTVVEVLAETALPQCHQLFRATTGVRTLNVAGPRESEAPGIYAEALDLLERAFDSGMGG